MEFDENTKLLNLSNMFKAKLDSLIPLYSKQNLSFMPSLSGLNELGM